jgi:hypothetical protein
VARACAEQARKDAENVRGTTVEKIHRETHTRYLRFAKMVKAVRLDSIRAAADERASAVALILPFH